MKAALGFRLVVEVFFSVFDIVRSLTLLIDVVLLNHHVGHDFVLDGLVWQILYFSSTYRTPSTIHWLADTEQKKIRGTPGQSHPLLLPWLPTSSKFTTSTLLASMQPIAKPTG
jgi:hypothetical protein